MGAMQFLQFVDGPKLTLNEATGQAIQDAQYESGHGGYSGTMAEKSTAVRIPTPEPLPATEAEDLAYELMNDDDPRIADKWGPAGAIKTLDGWLFFGWASS